MSGGRAPVAAVCFDLDGTLLRDDHLEEIVLKVSGDLARQHPGLRAEALAAEHGRVWAQVWREVELAWYRGEQSSHDAPVEAWRRVLGSAGVTDLDAPERVWRAQAALEREAWRLYDEAEAVLDELGRRGIRTAIITNGPSALQREKLAAMGLTDRFDAIIVSAELGIEKPRPEIFAAALDALGVAPGQALHIGDNPHADVAGSMGAGLGGVWVDRFGGRVVPAVVPDAVVPDLRGLLPLLG